MKVCPNTSPLLVLGRMGRLDLLGAPNELVLTEAVLAEVFEKRDDAADRVERLIAASARANPVVGRSVDPDRDLGPGERSVLALALTTPADILCVLDDAAARAEARRLGLRFTGTLGLVLRARVEGRIALVVPLLHEAVAAGLYLDDVVLASAAESVGEAWAE